MPLVFHFGNVASKTYPLQRWTTQPTRSGTVTDCNAVRSSEGFGGGLTPNAFLEDSQFILGTSATDNDDRFIYDPSTGNLFDCCLNNADCLCEKNGK